MLFNAPVILNETKNIYFPDNEELSSMPCGLHRGSYCEFRSLFPELVDPLLLAPVKDLKEYEIDLKIHMLMKGQYPCIPNWHCDNVPRDADGNLKYGEVQEDAPPMLLWLSGKPTTEFLIGPETIDGILDHGVLNDALLWLERKYAEEGYGMTQRIPEKTWVSMDQRTPHRGTAATENCWRVFIRLTHKSIAPARPVYSTIRRHCQVYLPHDFHW